MGGRTPAAVRVTPPGPEGPIKEVVFGRKRNLMKNQTLQRIVGFHSRDFGSLRTKDWIRKRTIKRPFLSFVDLPPKTHATVGEKSTKERWAEL